MLLAFIFGWCGSVPLSVLIAYLLRHHGNPPPPPDPWGILVSNVLGGIVAVAATAGGLRAEGEFGSVMLPIALGVITAGLVGVVRMAGLRGETR